MIAFSATKFKEPKQVKDTIELWSRNNQYKIVVYSSIKYIYEDNTSRIYDVVKLERATIGEG